MPGVTARSAAKNMSRGKRAALYKNTIRVEAALSQEIESCTYGKITKALGNKMFLVKNTNKEERVCHIRGRMTRVNIDDVVLLNIRDYESRSNGESEVYDVMAVFNNKDVAQLIKTGVVPSWMSSHGEEDEEDIFDYSDENTGDEKECIVDKKNKKNNRVSSNDGNDSELDIDAI